MDKKNNMTLLIPKNLNLKKILQEHPPNFKYKPQFFYYLVNLIYQIPLRYDKLECPNGYVPFSSKKLKRKVNSYKRYLEYLMDHNILEPDNHYIVSEKSKGYRLTKEYSEQQPVEKEINTSKRLEESISKEHKPDPKAVRKYHYLYKWFNENLQIDERAAMDYINRKKEEEITHNRSRALHKYWLNKISIKYLHKHNYWFHASGRDKRLHTNLTCLKGELRNFITYNGKKLVAIDISNSQPYLSIKLIDKYLKPSIVEKWKQKVNLKLFPLAFSELIPPQSPTTSSLLLEPIIPNYTMLVQDVEDADHEDVVIFKKLVKEGTFYEVFIELFEKRFDNIYFSNNPRGETKRAIVKDVMFEVFYSKNSYNTKEKRLFRDTFPTVDEVYRYHKRINNNKLPIKLQKLEANIVLDKVCKLLSRENPEIPLFTIHDSIVATVEHKVEVRAALYYELKKEIKCPPKLKFEYWKPENAD